MNDLEEQVRQELRRHAGSEPLRPMPPGTSRRVRRRQARAVVAAALTVCVLGVAGVSLDHVIPGSGKALPAGTGTPSVTGSPALSPSFGPWPVVVFGGNHTPYPGTDRALTVVAFGSVDGIPWSAVGGHDCVGLFVRKDGGTLCRDHPVNRSGLVVDSDADGATGIIGYVGALAPVVALLEVHLDNGDARSIDVIPGPPGAGVNYFVLFPSPRATGTIVAMDANGAVLGTVTLCAWNSDLSPNTSSGHPCTP